MNNNNNVLSDYRRILTPLLVFLAVVSPCFVIYQAAYRLEFLTRSVSYSQNLIGVEASLLESNGSDSISDNEELSLEEVLKEASMDDKTVILTTLNEAWAVPGSVLDLFLESFRIGYQTHKLLNHLVIIALDRNAYTRCMDVHGHCYALTTEGVDFSKEAYFMTPDYLKMMWRRIDFLRSILQMGYNFIFTVPSALFISIDIYTTL
ncbi:hypothetical protein GIB67_006264 [Kingdonia uniflora]|uniref:Nucleotide-diphospho-sugar transferase domain-containing protein n=1 Tax=Kingdonia uniflora TaxID=39325 RepID=A0A7J7P5R9_9MAGN|nr:hypothetical protein GIB67_006264 [Kingdonia uniflora]